MNLNRERTNVGVWWTPAMNKWHDQTGIAHAIHDGGLACGAKPYSTGGSFRTAEEAGAHECRRCRAIVNARGWGNQKGKQ